MAQGSLAQGSLAQGSLAQGFACLFGRWLKGRWLKGQSLVGSKFAWLKGGDRVVSGRIVTPPAGRRAQAVAAHLFSGAVPRRTSPPGFRSPAARQPPAGHPRWAAGFQGAPNARPPRFAVCFRIDRYGRGPSEGGDPLPPAVPRRWPAGRDAGRRAAAIASSRLANASVRLAGGCHGARGLGRRGAVATVAAAAAAPGACSAC